MLEIVFLTFIDELLFPYVKDEISQGNTPSVKGETAPNFYNHFHSKRYTWGYRS